MTRLPIALLLALATLTAAGGLNSQPANAGNAGEVNGVQAGVQAKGIAVLPDDAGLTRDARAQQVIDAATATALIGALETRFKGYDVQLQLGDVLTKRVSLRDLALNGEARLRLGKNQAWLPIRFDALYDTTEQTVLTPNIVLGETLAASRSADALPLKGLQSRVDRAMDGDYLSNQVDFSLSGARVVGDDGVRLVVQGDGVARFDGKERVAVTLQAIYDRGTQRWVDPQYALIDG